MIQHDNIFYVADINVIGGVETYLWELVKKYQDYDIAVVYKTGNEKQINRLKQYCMVYRHINQRIKCKVAIINYDVSIINFIDEGADIYQTIHGDYSNKVYTWKPLTHPRIKSYICITKYMLETFEQITHCKNTLLCYNPLTIDQDEEKMLILVSATRLTKIKGKDRMIALANALDNAGIKYIWYVFTNDVNAINSPNVVYMKPRLDVRRWISKADYVIQLSDTEALCYTMFEALFMNKPIICTPFPFLKEFNIEDGKNAWILNFDCSNIKHIVDNIMNIPEFNYKQFNDGYEDILSHTPSHFKEDKIMKVKVEALDTYEKFNITDAELGRVPKAGEQFEVTKERLNILMGNNASGRVFVKVIEPIKEIKKAVLPTKKVSKRRK